MESKEQGRYQPEPHRYRRVILALGTEIAAKLRHYRSQYFLESFGFSKEVANRLIFFKWLVEKKGLNEQDSRSIW